MNFHDPTGNLFAFFQGAGCQTHPWVFIPNPQGHLLEGGKMEINSHLPNILVVDDEIGPRESLRMILKPNYNVFCAEDGNAALQTLRGTEMDVVTLDLKMPGMSGMDTLKQIRLIDSDVMIIIITGFGTLRALWKRFITVSTTTSQNLSTSRKSSALSRKPSSAGGFNQR